MVICIMKMYQPILTPKTNKWSKNSLTMSYDLRILPCEMSLIVI
jgi:hypothetical protein